MSFEIFGTVKRRVVLGCALLSCALAPRPAHAQAVGVVSGFAPAGSAASGTLNVASLAPQGTPGTYRLMVVAVAIKTAGALTDSAIYTVTATYGSKLFTVGMAGAASANPSAAVWIGALKDSQIPLVSSPLSVTVTSKGPAVTGVSAWVATFSGVSQQWPIADGSAKASASPATVPAAIVSPSSPAAGAYVTALAAPTVAPSLSTAGYTSTFVTGTTNVGSWVGYKLGAGTDIPSGTSTSGPLSLASVSLNPSGYIGVGDGTPGSLAPMVAIMNPSNGEKVTRSAKGFKVQARIFSPTNGGASQKIAVGDVTLFDSDVLTTFVLTQDPKYGGTTDESGIWSATCSSAASNGSSVKLQVQAKNASGTVKSRPVTVTIVAPDSGDGNLLVRDNSSQLCNDCHALPIHSSETSGNRLGSWAVVCRDCHVPHGTTNIFLVPMSVTPPSITRTQTAKTVVFTSIGADGRGYATATNNSVCQGCHTRTTDAVGTPLFRNNAASDLANHSPSQDCMSCHSHAKGYPAPAAGSSCHDCHGTVLPRSDGITSEAAPPVDTCGNSQGKVASAGAGPNRVGAHKVHLLGTTSSPPVDCFECHPSAMPHATQNKCSTALSDRAVFSFSALATGAVDGWSPSVATSYIYGTPASPVQTCGSVYCHGAFRYSGVSGNVSWNNTVACGGCHGSPPPVPHPGNTACANCHLAGSSQTAMTGVSFTNHVNGLLDRGTNASGCTQCHGLLSATAVPNTDTRAAPGLTGQVDSKDNASTATQIVGVGAHKAHLQPRWSAALKCVECHPADATAGYPTFAYTDLTHADGTFAVPFPTGSISRKTYGISPINPALSGTTTVTCASTFCHGNFNGGAKATPTWNVTGLTGVSMTCVTCHGSPPTTAQGDPNGHDPAGTDCVSCHGTGYCAATLNGCTAVGISGAAVTTHLDGAVTAPFATKCKACHAARAKIANSSPVQYRAAVVGKGTGLEGDDFVRKSRHVSDGGVIEIVKNVDCVLCHLEGELTSTETAPVLSATYHGNTLNGQGVRGAQTVDLRNVDSAGGTGLAVSWPGRRLDVNGVLQTNPLPNGTTYTVQRDGMDLFCMNCHDSNGASTVTVNATSDGLCCATCSCTTLTRAMMPFNPAANVKNAWEPTATLVTGQISLPTWRMNAGTGFPTAQNNRVLNVKGDAGVYGFNGQNYPTGTGWASHHNLKAFPKRYSASNTAAWPAANWTLNAITREGANLQSVGEGAVLHCSDCHLNEANAHGSKATWYMLANSTGNDIAFTNSASTTSTDVCAKCHAAAVYNGASTATTGPRVPHNSCGKWIGTTNTATVIGADTAAANLSCLACHGGGTPGAIHGVNKTYTPRGAGTATSKTYRFLGSDGAAWHGNGADGRSGEGYNPASTVTTGWTEAEWTRSSGTGMCYTAAATAFTACAAHSAAGREPTPTVYRTRQLAY